MALELSSLVNIFATPTEVFLDVRERAKWLLAFVFIGVVSISIALLTAPFSKEIAHEALSRSMSGPQLRQSIAVYDELGLLAWVAAPLFLIARWLIFAGIVYFLTTLLSDSLVKFKTIFAVFVHTEPILLLMGVINLLLLHMRKDDGFTNPIDLQAVAGADYFLTDRAANLPLFTLLNNINVFSIWYVATLIIGVSVVTKFSKLKSGLIVVVVWAFGIGFQVAMSALTSRSS
jgi:hypothetical protein